MTADYDSARKEDMSSSHSVCSHSESSSTSHHTVVAESIASLQASSIQEVPRPSRAVRKRKKLYKKWFDKFEQEMRLGCWKTDGEVFRDTAISAGPEPDDIQVTFSWDTEPDWDTSQQLEDPELTEDCVISVLARYVLNLFCL